MYILNRLHNVLVVYIKFNVNCMNDNIFFLKSSLATNMTIVSDILDHVIGQNHISLGINILII